MGAAVPNFLSVPGELGAIVDAFDWSKSSLGPPESWPQSLRSALGICFNCEFPIAIYWGPDRILFYNESWRPIVGNKHPGSFGRPAREVWPEIWDVIDPLFRSVEVTGTGKFNANQLLLMHRFGYTEECYFDFTFSPIKEPDGSVGGIFNAVLETTFRVLSERRAKTLAALSAGAKSAEPVPEICRQAAGVLNDNPTDVPFALFHLAESSSGRTEAAHAAASSGLSGGASHSALLEALRKGPVARVLQSGKPERIENLSSRFGAVVGKAWPDKIETALVLPLLRPSGKEGLPVGAVVLGVNPRRALDAEYETFMKQIVAHVASSVLNALAYQEEKKRAEALAEIDRAKTAFFSNVSHEFRTPLTLMLGPLEDSLADARDPLSGPQRERQELAYRNALRLLRLVNSLLDYSRIESGRAKAVFRPTDLAHLTRDLASVFRSAIEKAGLRFTVRVPEHVENAFVDREMWEKIVLNLLSNSFKFTLRGEIEVTLAETSGGTVELRVRDTGSGIPASELPRLFERFYRVEGAKGRSHEGTGIGLALIKELVGLHGGSVRAESREGEGSAFVVTLPLGRAHLPPDQIEESGHSESRGLGAAFVQEAMRWLPDEGSIAPMATTQSKPGALPRVLLADDNADMRRYVKGILAGAFDVITAADGQAALALARQLHPDLILSDVMMPNLDGFALVKELRAPGSPSASIPVILLSARAGEEATIEGLQSGADDYLVKPFSAKELLARVRTHLQLAERVKERERAELALRESLQARDDFLSIASHELKTPLTSLQLQAQLHKRSVMKRDPRAYEPSRVDEIVSQTEKQVSRLNRLVDDMLDVSRIRSGKLSLEREEFDLGELTRDVITRLGDQFTSSGYSLPVVDARHDARGLWDRVRLEQVLTNLLTNAIRYGKKLPIRVSVCGGAESVRLEVLDQGIGISPALQQRIFDRYERGVSPSEISGLGLGLFISRQIVVAHGGLISVESTPDKGSKFVVELPRRASAETAVSVLERPAEA